MLDRVCRGLFFFSFYLIAGTCVRMCACACTVIKTRAHGQRVNTRGVRHLKCIISPTYFRVTIYLFYRSSLMFNLCVNVFVQNLKPSRRFVRFEIFPRVLSFPPPPSDLIFPFLPSFPSFLFSIFFPLLSPHPR